MSNGQLQTEVRSHSPIQPPSCTPTTTQIPAARYAYAPVVGNRPPRFENRPSTAPPRKHRENRLPNHRRPGPCNRPQMPPSTPEPPLNVGNVVKPDITARPAGTVLLQVRPKRNNVQRVPLQPKKRVRNLSPVEAPVQADSVDERSAQVSRQPSPCRRCPL